MRCAGIHENRALLHSEEGRALLSYALYQPTEEKIRMRADQYVGDEEYRIFFAMDGAIPSGLCILHPVEKGWEIQALSVVPRFRRQGIARSMIQFLHALFPDDSLTAETDIEAVDFYIRCGFEVTSLGEKYPGTVRYTCVLRKEKEA